MNFQRDADPLSTAARGYDPVKRAADVLLSGLALLFLSPLLILLALLVKSTSAGPAIFRQPRVGLNGELFAIWKFRTMRDGAETSGPAITSALDRRITPVGRLLRSLKLDELPQLWNVLRGEMSLVGPRPQVADFVRNFPEDLKPVILSVRPGITGPAQVRFLNEDRMLEGVADRERYYIDELLPRKCRLDAEYVRTRSLSSDARVLAETGAQILGQAVCRLGGVSTRRRQPPGTLLESASEVEPAGESAA